MTRRGRRRHRPPVRGRPGRRSPAEGPGRGGRLVVLRGGERDRRVDGRPVDHPRRRHPGRRPARSPSATIGRPVAPRRDRLASLGLTAGRVLDRPRARRPSIPVELTAELVDGTVRFAGAVPDDGSAVELTAGRPRPSGARRLGRHLTGLSVGDVAWTEATVVVLTGLTAAPDDQRYEALPAGDPATASAAWSRSTSAGSRSTPAPSRAGPASSTSIDRRVDRPRPITFGAELGRDRPGQRRGHRHDRRAARSASPACAVEVVGHTDDQGAEEENFTLSQLRAEAVVERLVELGAWSEARFTARGEGESVTDRRQRNRRGAGPEPAHRVRPGLTGGRRLPGLDDPELLGASGHRRARPSTPPHRRVHSRIMSGISLGLTASGSRGTAGPRSWRSIVVGRCRRVGSARGHPSATAPATVWGSRPSSASSSGKGELVAGVGVDRRHRAASPAARWSGWLAVDAVVGCARATGPTTRSGRTMRMIRAMALPQVEGRYSTRAVGESRGSGAR